MKDFDIIVAVARNGVIGNSRTNDLPWRIPADLKHFKEKTMGKTVIMGSKTFDSLPNSLPGRQTVIITRDPGKYPTQTCYTSLVEALESETGELMVIGGGQLYKEAMDIGPKTIYITVVDIDANGDVLFHLPNIANSVVKTESDIFIFVSVFNKDFLAYNKHNTNEWQEDNGVRFKFCEMYQKDISQMMKELTKMAREHCENNRGLPAFD